MKLHSVYSFSKIERHIRNLGAIRFPYGSAWEKMNKSSNPAEVIYNFLSANHRPYQEYHTSPLPKRINNKGISEGYFMRSTITDIYRMMLSFYPSLSLYKCYNLLYTCPITFTHICPDIHKRVYLLASCEYRKYPLVSTEDEYGIDTLALADARSMPIRVSSNSYHCNLTAI